MGTFRASRFGAAVVLAMASCHKPAPQITAEPDAGGALVLADGGDAATDASADASPSGAAEASDAESGACVPGETWDARVVTRRTWHPLVKMMLPGPLELVVPRMGARKAIYPDCGITGGGCGDCGKPSDPGGINCELTPARVRVDIGLDDVGPTYVDVVQRGDKIFADWTRGGFMMGPGTTASVTKSSELLVTLPCAVKIRFVR